ncbi:MAG: dTMP kinase [Chloroflexi bacterium]|nr:dTMP kinase [Chloroflexota bacterium]
MASESLGLFVSFEGGEGTGKTTQATLLIERLKAMGHRVEAVHEPGGTDLGEYLREWVKGTNKPLTPAAELLLFTAARAELVRRVIRPELEKGVIVVADRYADSTTVYQGYARQVPLKFVASANKLATDGIWPHLTFLLDAPNGVGLRRTRFQASFDEQGHIDRPGRPEEGDARRFEEAADNFHKRVRDGYRKLALKEPGRWVVLDAERPVDRIFSDVWHHVQLLLVERAAPLADSGRLPGL